MNREGSLFPRCRCGGPVKDGRCRRNPDHGRKDTRWCFKIDVGAEGGVRRTVSGTYPTRATALASLDAVRREQAAGNLVRRSRATTGEYMARWLEMICADIAETTARQYERYWVRLEPHLGNIRLQALTREDVLLAYARLKKGGLSDSTIHSMHIMFHHALSNAVDAKHLFSNPAAGTHSARLRPRTEVLTQQDLPGSYRACDTDPHGPFYVFCLETGLRRGEGLAIRWRDLNFDGGLLSVYRQLVEVQRRTLEGWTTSLIFKDATKSGSGLRTIAIGADLLSLLKTHQCKQQDLHGALGLPWRVDDQLAWTASNVRRSRHRRRHVSCRALPSTWS